ncbi:MAG: 7TM-DISM domain-containing protein [Spirosomataceae bacterium]
MKKAIAILLFLLTGLGIAYSQKTYHVTSEASSFSLEGYLETYEDSTCSLDFPQIAALYQQNRFTSLPYRLLNSGYSSSQHWLHFRLSADAPRELFIEIDNPRINHLWFYEAQRDSLIQQIRTGDLLPFASRGFPNQNWVFPITLRPDTPTDIFVMAEKRYEVLGVKVKLWEADEFERKDRSVYLFWGVLGGITLLIVIINLVGWVATRQTIYFWFVCLISAIIFHILGQSGLGFQYMWANSPSFNWLDPQLISGWFIMIAQLHFMQVFIGQNAANSRIFKVVQGYKAAMIGCVFVNILLRYYNVFPTVHFRWTFNTLLISLIISVLLSFWSIFERIRQREKAVLFYTFTLCIQLIGYLFVFLVNLAFVEGKKPLFDIDSYYIIVVNFLFDLIFLSSGILFFWFKNYQLENKILLTALHQNEQEQSQKIIEALEIERNRIAEDLYDDVGAMLSTAIGYLSSAVRKPEIKERFPILLEARKLLDRAVENLRTVSHNLMPKNFAQLGLSKSLAETVDKVAATTDIAFQYIVVGQERRLSAATEVQVFRIASELINDVLKNSGATEATFQLVYGEDGLQLISEDNGEQPPAYNNLTSKVAFVNGNLDIDAGPTGVTAIVDIPYQ